MTTEYSIQKMVSDGTLSTIALGMQYLQRNDIYIRIAGEETPQSGAPSGYTWSFTNNTTLKILPVVPNGVEVVVYRRTDIDAMYNIYSQNAQFDEATIDENNQQLLYIAQEYLEQGIPGAGVDTLEFVRDDGTYTYYRIKRTDGSYSDEFAVPSAGSATKIFAREALRRSYAEAGYNLVVGSFEAGGTLVNANDALLHEATGEAFKWGGAHPKVVPPSSSPATTGGVSASGWLPLGDITLRQELASAATGKGVSLVANAADKRGEIFTGGVSAIGLKSPTLYGDAIIGDNPVGSPGADYPGPEALRDAVTVSRKLVNTPTDCHGFSDKTVIDTPSDYGGYGAFDATVILRGAHTQDHVACFQARTKLEGTGVVKNLWGAIVWPVSTGTSTIQVNTGAFIKNVETSTSVVERNRGIDIVPFVTTQENIGINVRAGDCIGTPPKSFVSEQTGNGYSLYAHYLGALYNKGKAFFGDFGTDNPAGGSGTSALNVRGAGSSVMVALDSTNSEGAVVIATGDSRVSFVSNAALLGYWGNTSDSRGWIAANNTVPLGTVGKRWQTVYLVTSPNVSSDERFKDFEAVSDAEVSCAREVKSIMRKYRLKNDGDKIHFGVGAQSIVEVFEKHGLNAVDYNIVSVDSGGLYSITYEELLCFVVLGL